MTTGWVRLWAWVLGLAWCWGVASAQPVASPPATAASATAVAAAKATLAQRAAALPAEVFFKNPEVLEAKLSPAGTHLAITTAAGTNRVALVVFDLAPGGIPLRAAHFSDADVVRFDWVNDRRLVFSVADLESGSGEDRYYWPGLYAVDLDGKKLRHLVARQPSPFFVSGTSMGREVLPWNHRLLHVPRFEAGSGGDEVIVGAYVFRGKELTDVMPLRLNTRTGRHQSINLDAPPGSRGWFFDSSGEARVVVALNKGRRSLHWRGLGQTEWRLLDDSEDLRAPFSPNHVDDAGNLYVTHPAGPEGTTVLSRFDFERRAPAANPWVVAPGFDFNGTVLSVRRGGAAAGVRLDTDAETTVWVDDIMKRVQALVDERFPATINRVDCRRCGEPDMVMLVHQFADRHPGRLWLYRAATREWQGVAPVHSGIDPMLMAQVDFQRIKARDGRDLPVWLTLPLNREAGKPGPAVVLVHGGPWVRGGHWRFSAMEQFLASRGYLVISPDFRGSRGYGWSHFRAGWKQWGQAMQDDVADALLWAQTQGLADKNVCIAGASYGGYATLMGLVRHPELYRCGIAWVAVTDPFLYLEGSWWVQDDISDSGRRYSLPQLVGDAKADAEMLTRVSPVAQAEHIRAPLLLAFGEADLRVPLAHGKRLREAMQKAGREPQWVTYPNEGHSWRLPETRVDFAKRMEGFLAEHLMGMAPK